MRTIDVTLQPMMFKGSMALRGVIDSMRGSIEKAPMDEETGLMMELTEEMKQKLFKDQEEGLETRWKQFFPEGVPEYVDTESLRKIAHETMEKVLESSVCNEDTLAEVEPPAKCGSPRYRATDASEETKKTFYGGTLIQDMEVKAGEGLQWRQSKQTEALARLKRGEGPDGVRQIIEVGFPDWLAKMFNVPVFADFVADEVEAVLVKHQSKSA